MSFEIHLRCCGGLAVLSLALASCGGGSDNSAVTPVTATPTFSVASGPYTTTQSVTISDTTSGAVIYYTLDGTTPATAAGGSTLVYSGALSVTSSTIIEAVALAPSHTVSALNDAAYTIGPAAAAAGIWVGPDSEATPVSIIGFVTSGGQSVFIHAGATNADIYMYSGPVTVAGTTFSSALDGFSNFPNGFADNSTTGVGTFDATLAAQATLTGPLTFTSAGGTSYPSTWTLNYSSDSLVGSSLTMVAGKYTDAGTTADPILGATVTISAAGGTILSTAASSGCIMSGAIGTSDPTTNIYEISYTFTDCTASPWTALNGVTFAGLAALDTGASQLVTAASSQGGGTPYGLVLAFNLN